MAKPNLTYRIAPDKAFASETRMFTITGTNNTDQIINFTENDQLNITFPLDLVSSFNNVIAATPSGSGFSVAKGDDSGAYILFSTGSNTEIKQGEKITVTFSKMPITGTVAKYTVALTEYIGSGEANVSLDINVITKELGVIAWLEDLNVGQLLKTKLHWESVEATKVVISGVSTSSGSIDVDLSGAIEVFAPLGQTQWTFTVVASSGNNQAPSVRLTLTVQRPVIYTFAGQPNNNPIDVDAEVSLSWHTKFATSVILTTPTIPNQRYRIPANPVTVEPGKNLLKTYKYAWTQLPAGASYILTANGYQQAAVKELNFNLNHVKLDYLKFETAGSDSATYKISPSNWRAVSLASNEENNYVLYVHQPGGTTDTYYLGSNFTTHPQITSFNSSPSNGKFKLNWTTANLQSLSLNGQAITTNDIESGSKDGISAGTYTLIGKATNGEQINSILVVNAAS